VVVGRAVGGPGWRLELCGDDGTVTVALDPHFRAHGAGVELAHDGPPPLRLSLACFIDAVARGDAGGVCCSLGDGVATLAVALAAQESAQRGAAVALA
jgi:hypothetical protein